MAPTGRSKRWIVLHEGRFYGRARSLAAAQTLVRRPYRLTGYLRAYHERSGEEWERRRGIWYKSDRLAPESAAARTARAAGPA
jgi:hypothetical protein